MIGALIGDIVGSRFERNNIKSKNFELFTETCRPTDDSVMSLAIAKAILESEKDIECLPGAAIRAMQELGRRHPQAGYGGRFKQWLQSNDPRPYYSYGNGAAMRVGPCGYAANSVKEAKALSAAVTTVTHNHPEGVKGAEALTTAIFLARQGASKEELRAHIEAYYLIDFSLDDIRKSYSFDMSTQGTMPFAFAAFLESTDFIDCIRNAISIGGDSDTLAAISGSLAEAFYGVPVEMACQVKDYLSSDLLNILYAFERCFPSEDFFK